MTERSEGMLRHAADERGDFFYSQTAFATRLPTSPTDQNADVIPSGR